MESNNLISTIFGIGIILAYVSFGYEKGYRIRLTENSRVPGAIIEFYPADMAKYLKN